MQEGDYSIEEVDALTGSLIGLPNSASFRLLDLVGLDVWAFVGENLYNAVPDDPWRERFRMPEFHKEMMRRGWLGDKTARAITAKRAREMKSEIEVIDWKTFEYHPTAKVTSPTIEAAKQMEDLPQRLRFLVNAKDRYGDFLWRVFSDAFLYSAERIPEIADRIIDIDRAMRWGYAHNLAPSNFGTRSASSRSATVWNPRVVRSRTTSCACVKPARNHSTVTPTRVAGRKPSISISRIPSSLPLESGRA